MPFLSLSPGLLQSIKQKAIQYKHPIGAFFTWTSGDALTQKLEQRMNQSKTDVDYFRSICSGLYGMLFVTPIATRWYGKRLNGGINILPFSMRNKIQSLSKFKISLVQTGLTFGFCAPLFATSYITWMGFTYKDHNKSMIKNEAKKTFVPIVFSDLCFWPCADMINFTLVPPQHRFWAMLVEDIIWASILSIWGNDHEKIEHLHEVADHLDLKMGALLLEAFRASEDVFITAAFHILDKDASNSIELCEVVDFIKDIDMGPQTKETLLKCAFPNETKKMELEEFKHFLKSDAGKILKCVIQFQVIDVDKNGMLSYGEAAAMFGDNEATELWKKLHVFQEEEIDIKTYLKAFL